MSDNPENKSESVKHDRDDIMLQVLICAFGREGLERVAKCSHPAVKGVEYVVSWQSEQEYEIPDKLTRKDFKIFRSNTKGLSVNRNIALGHATAPLLLISDDDVDYTEEGLGTVIKGFEENPEADLLIFRYASKSSQKYYPEEAYGFGKLKHLHFVVSFEIAFRKDSVKGRIWFNENFGIGAIFPSGEEDIFIRDCLDSGLRGKYIPAVIVSHDGLTTSERNLMLTTRAQTKGAVCLRLFPGTWPLRMISLAIKEIPGWHKGLVPSPFSFIRNWLKGVVMAWKNNVYPTPDYSQKYLNHGGE